MRVRRLPRVLLLPALAVLLPSLFIVVLASLWLTTERETARLRGADAAAAALGRLRAELERNLTSAAQRIAATAHAQPVTLDARSDRAAAWPPLVMTAFVFDAAGRALVPRDDRDEADGPAAIARAAALLVRGAAALRDGRMADAARNATTLFDCCAHLRDEFGVSYALYASWQHAAIGQRRGTDAGAIVTRLEDAIGRDLLDRPIDVAGVRAFADFVGDAPGVVTLVPAVESHVAQGETRRRAMAAARDWIASVPASAAAGVIVADRRDGLAPAAALWREPPPGGASVVMTLDTAAIAAWIARWTDRESPFAFAMAAAEAAPGGAGQRIALFDRTPELIVAARPVSDDAIGNTRRERLFMTAAAAVLVLTLLAGGLAVRDVVRERRLAALRSTFVAGVTHEIKTPITSIRLMAETLEQRRVAPDAAGELLATIVNEAAHLGDLVDNLLSTSRIESGTRTYRPRVVSLAAEVRDACRRFGYTLQKEGFTLDTSVTAEPVAVRADSEALQLAVLNLLGNAVKYSGASRVIRLQVDASDREAFVRVEDAGVGIARAEHRRIFKSFYRTGDAASATTGTGLGLALVRHFADAHGGSVSVTSAPDRGSVFTIALPRVEMPERAEPRDRADG